MKRIFCIFLSAVMILCAAPLGGFAQLDLWSMKASAADGELAATGSCGENVYWNYDSATGALTISGSGAMTDYENNDSPFLENTQIRKVIFESGITTIGRNAFTDCTSLTEVSISETVESIEAPIFHRCKTLQKIVVNETNEWFTADENGILFNKDISVLYKCPSANGITDYTVPSTVTDIFERAFQYHASLKRIVMQDTVEIIENRALYGCSELLEVRLPSQLERIEDSLFNLCIALNSINIPETITFIGEFAFANCQVLEFTHLPENLQYIGPYAFAYCYALKNVTIPDSVETVKNDAFYCCSGLLSVDLPFGLLKIEDSAFEKCSSLAAVELPETVKTIGNQAFLDCAALTEISFSYAVTAIGNFAFTNCSKLENVYFNGTESQWDSISFGGSNDPLLNADIYFQVYSDGTLTWVIINNRITIIDCEETAKGSLEIPDIIDSYPVTAIGESAFYHCLDLKEVIIPDSMKYIYDYAFLYSGLVTAWIPSSVTFIGIGAFRQCQNLTKIAVDPENPYYSSDDYGVLFNKDKTVIEQYPFYGSASYTIPDSVTEISESAFERSDYLRSITFGSSVKYIRANAFARCGLETVRLSESVESIEDRAFINCTRITEIRIPDKVTAIGDSAFCYCSGLTEITIPDSVVMIGDKTFENCGQLADVYYSGSQEQWDQISIGSNNTPLLNATIHFNYSEIDDGELAATGNCGGDTYWTFDSESGVLTVSGTGNTGNYAFPGSSSSGDLSPFYCCSGIRSVIIDNGITGIGSNMFYGCADLESVSLPNSLLSINTYAFYSCTGLIEITIPENVISISNNAFANCSGLKTVFFNAVNCNSPDIGGNNKIFENCTSLETVIFGDKAASVPPYAFYGCAGLKDVIIGSNVTEIGVYAFCKCSDLTDIIIPEKLTSIGAFAFSSCSKLTNVVTYGEVDFQKYTFAGTRASIIIMDDAPQTKKLAGQYNINCIDVDYDHGEKVLSFNGTTTVYDGAKYDYIAKAVYEHPETEYLYFDKLIFDGIKNDEFSFDDFEFVDLGKEDLTFNHLYINIKMINGGESKVVTFEQMLETLKNGDYDAFRLQIKSDEVEHEQSLIEKFFHRIVTDALNAISKAINFFAKLFKRK